MKNRIHAFDFIRVVSALGVFLFHLSIALSDYAPQIASVRLPDQTGFLFVTCFFMLSGALLEYQYGHRLRTGKERRDYARKRFLAVFPSFYLCFVPLFLIAAWRHHSFFFRGTKWPLLLSLVGMDGYFSSSVTTYYMIGEWFLGGLIIMYLLYPLLSEGTPRQDLAAGCMILLLYILTCSKRLLAVSPLANIPSCLVSFYAGILFVRHHLQDRVWNVRILTLLSCGITSLCLGTKGRVPEGITLHLAGLSIFLILYLAGRRIHLKLFRLAGAYTYEFFLVHHLIIDRMTFWFIRLVNPDRGNGFFLLAMLSAVIFAVSSIAAWILHSLSVKLTGALKKGTV